MHAHASVATSSKDDRRASFARRSDFSSAGWPNLSFLAGRRPPRDNALPGYPREPALSLGIPEQPRLRYLLLVLGSSHIELNGPAGVGALALSRQSLSYLGTLGKVR